MDDTASTTVPRLWERARQSARVQIVETAMDLFVRQGFDATTIDQIATAAGISRRSFFRYFGTKEDILLGDLGEVGERIRSTLAARPLAEDPWTALRAAFGAMDGGRVPRSDMLRANRVLLDSAALRARHVEKHRRWQAALTPEIERRLGIVRGPVPDAGAAAIVAAALACLDTAMEIWTLGDGAADLEALYDEAVAAVRR